MTIYMYSVGIVDALGRRRRRLYSYYIGISFNNYYSYAKLTQMYKCLIHIIYSV